MSNEVATTEDTSATAEQVETPTPEQTTPTPAPVLLTKAELRAADLKAKREEKQAIHNARKAANADKRADGVIGTLHKALQTPEGTTKKEILAVLTAKFPTRDPIGMATTVGIQLSRLQQKHGKIVSRKQGERGLVYGYAATVQYAAEGSPGVAADTATPSGVVAAVDLMKQAGAVANLPREDHEEELADFNAKMDALDAAAPEIVTKADGDYIADKAQGFSTVETTPEPAAKSNKKGSKKGK